MIKGGKCMIEPKFSDIKILKDNLIAVLLDKKWGVIDKNGNYVIEPKYDEIKQIEKRHLCSKNKWQI